MYRGIEDYRKLSSENFEKTVANLGAVSKNLRDIAAGSADYSKRNLEDGAAFAEKLMGVKSLESAVELQTEYVKASYENALEQANKIGELYNDLAAMAWQPFNFQKPDSK